MKFENVNFNKYENFIRVGHKGTEVSRGKYTSSDLANFPTPSMIARTLHDVDKDPFTDLQGYTHRNRVRNNVEDLVITYNVASDDDLAYILERINPEYIYVELTDKKTKEKKVHKMYASDKTWNTHMIYKDENGNWIEQSIAFSFSLIEE